MAAKVTQLSIDYVQDRASISITREGADIGGLSATVKLATPGDQRENMNEKAAVEAVKAFIQEALAALNDYDPKKS